MKVGDWRIFRRRVFTGVGAVCAAFLCGCEDGGGGGGGAPADIGENNAALVVCVGDSITHGDDGVAYPPYLAALSGKSCSNCGVGGAEAKGGVNLVKSALSKKPGYVCILFGANDAINGRDASATKEAIRAMVVACKNNKSVPVLGTTPPMLGEHLNFNDAVDRINQGVREVASEEGARLADIHGAFGNGEGLLMKDGLHPNEAGAQKIAECFNKSF